MPSKYDAHYGVSQETVDKLVIVEPELQSSQITISALGKRVLEEYASGQLVYLKNIKLKPTELKDKLVEARLADIKANTTLKKLEIQLKLVHDFHKSPDIALAVAKGEMTLAQIGLDPTEQVEQQEPKPILTQKEEFVNTANNIPISIWNESENQLCCGNCPAKFEYRYGIVAEMMNVVSEYEKHVLNTHNRGLNDDEKKTIDEYLNWVRKGFVVQ